MEKTVISLNETNGVRVKSSVPDIFNGPIAYTTLKLSIPMLVTQLLSFTYIFVDTYFISMIDKQSTTLVSSVGLVFPIYLFFFNICCGLFQGTSSVVARGIGEKKEEVINKIGDSAFLLVIVISIITFVLSLLFGERIINFFAGTQLTVETINYGVEYFYYLLPGLEMFLVTHIFSGILQGEGLAKYIGWGAVFSTTTNIILNPILIFIFDLGVKGSAIATTIAIGLNLLYCAVLFFKGKTTTPLKCNVFNANKKLIKEVLWICVPASLGMFLLTISTGVLNNIVSSVSQAAMNAWVLVGRTDQLFVIPSTTIATTTITMIGQNYGRGNLTRAAKIFRVNVILSITICAVLALLYVIFARELFQLFSSVPEVIDGSVKQARILAFTTICFDTVLVISLSFQGTGRPLPNLITCFIFMLITCIPLCLPFFGFVIEDMTPIFICVGAGNILTFIIAFIWGNSHFKQLESDGKNVQI
jgi:putative MATE family efflux protein